MAEWLKHCSLIYIITRHQGFNSPWMCLFWWHFEAFKTLSPDICGVHMDSTWTPPGLHLDSIWTQSGLHMIPHGTSCGVYLEFIWSLSGVCGVYLKYVESTWRCGGV